MPDNSFSPERVLRPSSTDMRDAYFDRLYDIMAADRNVILITDDQGAFGVTRIQQELGDQCFNAGIAEQNIISVAAGMALGGKRPYVYGISTFMTMRCFEQINVDLCCMDLPVSILASGPGFTYSSDGPTHHSNWDLGILRILPGISLYSPSDATMTSKLAEASYENVGPSYIRIEKGVLPAIYETNDDASRGFETLRSGEDIAILSTGFMVHRALQVADALAESRIEAGVIDLYRVKPIDIDALLDALSNAKRLVTIEEHSKIGGIGTLIAELLADTGQSIPLKRIALPDRHFYDYGSRAWLHARNGLDESGLMEAIRGWL